MTNALLSKRVADLTMEDLMVVERAIVTSNEPIPEGVTFGVAFGYVDPTADFPMSEDSDTSQMPLTHIIEESDESYEAMEALLKMQHKAGL